VNDRNPFRMSEIERIEEIGVLLAIGYTRRISSAPLDLPRHPDALHVVLNGRDEAPRKEPA